jgi:hypothetical protein
MNGKKAKAIRRQAKEAASAVGKPDKAYVSLRLNRHRPNRTLILAPSARLDAKRLKRGTTR